MSEEGKSVPPDFPLGTRTPAEILALEARFKSDPASLSDEERLALVGLDWSRTRLKIIDIHRRRARQKGPDDAT